MAHPELEDPGEGGGRGRADHQRLQDAQPRVALHDAGHAQDRLARHQAVGIERQEQVVALAPAPQEVADVAGLPGVVAGAAAIDGVSEPRAPALHRRVLGGGDLGLGGVGEDEEVVGMPLPRQVQRAADLGEPRQRPVGRLVADRHRHGRAQADRLARVDVEMGRGLRHPVPRPVQQPQADDRVPGPHQRPGRAERDAGEDHHVRRAPPAGAEDLHGAPDHRPQRGQVQTRDQRPAPGQHPRPLQPGRGGHRRAVAMRQACGDVGHACPLHARRGPRSLGIPAEVDGNR